MTLMRDSSGTPQQFQPYVKDGEVQQEITVRAILLSIVLAVVLGAANVYLGLFAGLTVSASIPAAIISMSVLRTLFKDVGILENNLVQTGEVLSDTRCLFGSLLSCASLLLF